MTSCINKNNYLFSLPINIAHRAVEAWEKIKNQISSIAKKIFHRIYSGQATNPQYIKNKTVTNQSFDIQSLCARGWHTIIEKNLYEYANKEISHPAFNPTSGKISQKLKDQIRRDLVGASCCVNGKEFGALNNLGKKNISQDDLRKQLLSQNTDKENIAQDDLREKLLSDNTDSIITAITKHLPPEEDQTKTSQILMYLQQGSFAYIFGKLAKDYAPYQISQTSLEKHQGMMKYEIEANQENIIIKGSTMLSMSDPKKDIMKIIACIPVRFTLDILKETVTIDVKFEPPKNTL